MNNPLSLDEFHALSDRAQAAVAMQGDFLDFRQEGNTRIALYSLTHFYAEV